MSKIDHYPLLSKFSKNILFTIFDFLPTETVFLNLGLINKLFYFKAKDYQKIARTVELKCMNYPLAPIFPYIENLVFHMVNTIKEIKIKLPYTLVNLKFLGNPPPKLMIESFPSSLQSFKHSSYENQDNRFNNIYLSSLQTRTLKVLKVYKSADFGVLTYLENNRLTHLEEIYLPLGCNLDEATISLLLSNERLKNVSFCHALTERSDCVINGLYLLSQIKSLVKLTLPGCCMNSESGLDKVIRALPNLRVLKFSLYLTKCSVQNHIELLNNLSGIGLKKICTSVFFNDNSQDFISFFTNFLKAFPLLEVFKMFIDGVFISGHAYEVIRLCKEHQFLYKFNGLPLKLLEDSKATCITLYEDLLKTKSNDTSNWDLTMEIFYNYSYSLENMRELRIKPIRSAAICIYPNKIIEKIRMLGYFTDMQQYFKIPKWAFPHVLMIIRGSPELRSLKLEAIHNSRKIFDILEECTYLDEYEGPFSADLLQKVNFKSIKLNMRDKIIGNLDIFDVLKNPYVEKFSLKQASFIYEDRKLYFTLSPNLRELNLLRIHAKLEFLNSLIDAFKNNSLTTVCLDFDFLSLADINRFISSLQYLLNIEILNLHISNSVFLYNNGGEHTALIIFLENNIRASQQLKEFSLYINPTPHCDQKILYYNFLKQLSQSHPLLTKLYGISCQSFDMSCFRSIFT